MKTRLLGSLLLSCVLFLAACQPLHPTARVTPATPLTATEQRNLAVVQKLYSGLAQGDSKVVLDLYAEQYTKHFSGQAGQMARRQAVDEQKRVAPLLARFAYGNCQHVCPRRPRRD